MMFSDEMRQQLGFGGPSFEIGTWWCVPHAQVFHRDGTQFSKKKGDGRRVVLAREYGPNTTLFARSASVGTTYEHAAHIHKHENTRCKLNLPGWINLRLPVTVTKEFLNDDNFSCEEPAGTSLLTALRKALEL